MTMMSARTFGNIYPKSSNGNGRELMINVPVVPHKAVAEVSKIGNL